MKNNIFMTVLLACLIAVPAAHAQKIRPLGIDILATAHQDNPEWLWTPAVTFTVLGPLEAGSSLSVDYTLPNGKPFVTAKCETYPIGEGERRRFDLCGKDLESSKAINQTGTFGFQIKLKTASGAEDKVLFSGKFTVGRRLYNLDGTPDKNRQYYYFIDNDWRLPFAYIGTYYGDTSNNLYSEFWIKNRIQDKGAFTGQLFFNGKLVSEISPSFLVESHPKENPKQEFTKLGLLFQALMEKPVATGYEEWFKVYENPGNYEIKLMRDNKLARSIKFSIGKDGKPVANGVGSDLIGEGIIVPLQVLGDTDGVFNQTAWKDGVWGNPIKGLVIP
jgi:hypothetical protein